ncbi:hypothetical protein [Actinoplanes sp. NBRC 101535]|uniref:hypothetical protein n=1 Tax=Actinoplanes sp. NBRC 101535 TaxID=3032196 RepID=UPI002555024B|nr:hypothetical protein [Actinoplanes sp. NBRC 101535]
MRGIVEGALPNRLAAAHRLLLLMPFMGDAAAGNEPMHWLAQALELVSGRDRLSAEVRDLAEIMLENLPAPEWSVRNRVWANDGEYCERGPGGEYRRHPWSVERLRRVDVALAPPVKAIAGGARR